MEQKPEIVDVVDSDKGNKEVEKKEIDNEYFKHNDDDWKPEIIEISDSEDDKKEIENFLEKVEKEHKTERVDINKGEKKI